MFAFKNNVLNYIRENNFEAIHCHDFDGLFIGYSINRHFKHKLVYDEHDLFYTYFSERKNVINRFLAHFIKFYESFMLKKVDVHIVVTPKMVELYKNKSSKMFLINNAPYKNQFRNIDKTHSNKLRIGFIGSVRYYDEMVAMINASQKYKDKIDIIISGKGIYLDELTAYASKYSNVKLTGGYNINEIEELYRNIDVTYAFYPDYAAAISMPNKYFESIITETPIIANIKTEFGYEVNKNRIGYGLLGDNLEIEIHNVLQELLENENIKDVMIENMKSIKNECYWEANETYLDKIYNCK